MSGTVGETGFNYAQAFINSSAQQLETKISEGLDKKELHVAAKNALESLSSTLSSDSIEQQTQLSELTEKFAKIFPEDKETVGKVYKEALERLGRVEVEEDLGAVAAPSKPPREEKAKGVDFPKMIESVVVVKDSIGGTTGAKLVKSNGNKFVKKVGIPGRDIRTGVDRAAHVTSEYHTNRVYQALGVPVPAPMIYHTTTSASIKGELPSDVDPRSVTSAVMLTAFIEDSTPWDEFIDSASGSEIRQAEDKLRQHFALDCLLGNYDVIGYENDNVRVKDGVPYRIDNGSGLEHQAQGKPKGERFWGPEVTEIDNMRNPDHFKQEVANAGEIFQHVSDSMMRDQVKDLVANKHLILGALPPRYHGVINARLEYMQKRFPPSSQ